MKKFFLYARKSTDVEDKQVLSIDAQLNELREFANRDGIIIVAELIEKQSAKTPGRPIFNAMLERIEAGEADGILAWHPDRLARNSVDGGRIIYMLDTGKIKTLKFPRSWFENTPQGKLMLHNDFGFSKYFVDSLSENTKRGLREKVRRGEFPGLAPIGYLNDYRAKRICIVVMAHGPANFDRKSNRNCASSPPSVMKNTFWSSGTSCKIAVLMASNGSRVAVRPIRWSAIA